MRAWAADFWSGKRVLLTGHTGFKGAWLAVWLKRLGAEVLGVALPPATQPNLFELARVSEGMASRFIDLREASAVSQVVHDFAPQIVLHLAAQALVRASYADPVGTYATNFMGTVHVLEALRGLASVRVAVIITSDKVYHNREWPYPYREDDALGGHDPYSASKAAAEIAVASYRDAFLREQGVAVASARAGNVIGGGDWAEDRLIPDAVRAWGTGQVLTVRRPQAVRPWQHVLEPLHGYLALAQCLWERPELAGAYNFGPHTHEAVTVRELVDLARQAYGAGAVRHLDTPEGPHEAGWLALENAKARTRLGVTPLWGLGEAVRRTMGWYRAWASGEDAHALCLADLVAYERALMDTKAPTCNA